MIILPTVCSMMLLGSVTGVSGCEDKAPAVAPTDKTTSVVMGKKTFKLEIAATPDVRTKGLGSRKEIAEDGGMIFVFPSSQVRTMAFVMRDCPIDIDIAFLDGSGRVLTTHEMKAEPPRGPDEGKEGTFDNFKYESRLKQYSSRWPATFAIEVKAGTIRKLGLKEGDLVTLDAEGLKKIAQ